LFISQKHLNDHYLSHSSGNVLNLKTEQLDDKTEIKTEDGDIFTIIEIKEENLENQFHEDANEE
jgi:hypothetical protein